MAKNMMIVSILINIVSYRRQNYSNSTKTDKTNRLLNSFQEIYNERCKQNMICYY